MTEPDEWDALFEELRNSQEFLEVRGPDVLEDDFRNLKEHLECSLVDPSQQREGLRLLAALAKEVDRKFRVLRQQRNEVVDEKYDLLGKIVNLINEEYRRDEEGKENDD